ncbi:metallophosphoesterase 1 homolog isoform X1 [Diachasma alloeum]|uniref:metallophosphoesterase 1 homolog isoform X1 n=1 Tax=Diachasma alloeum TaxID=454923 RepID=UPI0007382C80|nr:metallophosphoesterase 1 homolog isoform X1 [Diachasma alloeum]
MIRRNRTKYKLFVIALILGTTILYCEFLAYEIQRFKWAGRECNECVKILLVADPQILGEKNENYFGAWFARWDSDRYLAKTFGRAMSHAQPDVIAFLGDLMDEGHISTMQDFSRYKTRFDRIFQTPEHILTIYLPGDNDIGGEEDSVSAAIHNRFKFAFSQPDSLTHKSLIFFKVNRLTHYMPKAPQDAFLNEYTERNTTNIILSHMPLLFTSGSFVKNVIKELSPQVIFTAHEHKAMHLSLDTTIDELSDIWILPPHETPLYQLRLDMGDIHELQIPTCSYRMGTSNMGYGLAYIDTRDKSVDFTILWLPERFPKLKGYLWIFSIVMIFIMSSFICNCCVWSTHVAYSHLPAV